MTAPADPPGSQGEHALPWAAYLAGDLPGDKRDELDRHLLRCDRCWREVRLARAGQAAAAAATETAPPHLYDRINAALENPPRQRRMHPRPTWRVTGAGRAGRRMWVPVAALALAAACFLGGVGFAQISRPVTGPGVAAGQAPTAPAPVPATTSAPPAFPDVLTSAVTDYDSGRLPGTGVPAEPAPILLDLDLHVMAAATGVLADHQVTVYAYANPATGQQIFVYLSPQQFDALTLPPGRTTGTTVVNDVTVYAAATAHPMLVLGSDANLVLTVGTRLT